MGYRVGSPVLAPQKRLPSPNTAIPDAGFKTVAATAKSVLHKCGLLLEPLLSRNVALLFVATREPLINRFFRKLPVERVWLEVNNPSTWGTA